jgi:REP element-mobilizing transposase RayT
MAATLTNILLHITYSTKHRQPLIPDSVLPDLFAYTGGICRDCNSPLLHGGGVADHVHLLVSLNKTLAVSELMQNIKRGSSAWLKQSQGINAFSWQDGYFAFSVSHDHVPAVRAYLDNQAAHHATTDFQAEVLAFLKKYEISFDAKYLWD